MRLRRAAAGDADAVTACVHAAYAHYVERIGARPGPMNDDYAKLIGEGRVTVADEGGSLVGVLVMSPGEGGLLLENIAVLPARQARGLGAELIAHAEAEAYRRGFSFIWLYTHEKMTENLAWYARLGYVELDRRTEHGFSRVFLRKSLR